MSEEDYFKYYIQGSDHYLIPKGVFDELFNELINWREENKQLKENWNELKKELKDKFEEFRYVEDECLRTMAQEDDSILFSMSCIEKGDSNE